MMEESINGKYCNSFRSLFNLLLLALGIGSFHINLGFALKPYMIVCLLILISFIILKKTKILKLENVEKSILIFYLYICATLIFSKSIDSSIRYIMGFMLILIFYFTFRELAYIVKRKDIENAISNIGIIISIITLIYYCAGIIKCGFKFNANGVRYYGVLLDRGIPRLVSVISSDPNITVFYLTLFISYYIYNIKGLKNKIGLLLTLLVIILTFSRGAYISLFLAFVITFLLNNNIKLKRKVFVLLIITILFFFMVNIIEKVSKINIVNIIVNRFDSIESDGGSGRIILWKNAIKTFYKYPILGIGINSSLDYNKIYYGTNHYIHNTFLEVLSETGIIGFCIYIYFCVSIIMISFKLYKKDKTTIYILMTSIGVMIQMLFLSVLLQESLFFLMALIITYYKECNLKN